MNQQGHIDVGGRCQAFQLLGQGAPVVVFETGLEDSSSSLSAIAAAVSQFTTALVYDRAGLGASDPAPLPRTSADVTRDLHTLLEQLGAPRPCIFVGHSFGGLHLRCYANYYPTDVAGLILVDSSHPDQATRERDLLPVPDPGEPTALTAARERLLEEMRHPAANAEGLDVLASSAQARAVQTLGSIPLIVITAGLDRWEDGFPPAVSRAIDADWQAMQRELAQLSTEPEQVIASASYHEVQESEPELIVAAVQQLVTRYRTEHRDRPTAG
jgi:pimeloyl-ACP methyl ester carboxylesterase